MWAGVQRSRGNTRGALRACCLVLAGLFALAGGEAAAEEPTPAADVELNDLLRLPSGLDLDYGAQRKGGATAEMWRKRFREARQDLARAKATLRESLDAMEDMGGDGAWKVAPPGLGQLSQTQNQRHQNPTGTDSANDQAGQVPFGASDITRQRAEVERAERALRDLEVEANLADVPEEWRH